MGHTVWWAGSYEVTPPDEVVVGGVDRSLSGQRYVACQPVHWVRPHPRSYAARGSSLNTWRAT
jgi:hypothetical protein